MFAYGAGGLERWGYNRAVHYGDVIMLRDRKKRRYLVRLREGGSFDHHRGSVAHSVLMQAGFGAKVHTQKDEPLWVSRAKLEHYILNMRRATTPTYPKDAVTMVMMMDLLPGMRVLEAGSGSGGLTLALSRAVGAAGQVISYEINPDFIRRAQANVHEFGADNVHFVQADLAEATLDEASVDAVALDLMEPWTVLEQVTRALKPDGSLIAYLPNITQAVQLLDEVHSKHLPYFHERTLEVMHREWDIRPPVAHPNFKQVGHTAFLVHLWRVQ